MRSQVELPLESAGVLGLGHSESGIVSSSNERFRLPDARSGEQSSQGHRGRHP